MEESIAHLRDINIDDVVRTHNLDSIAQDILKCHLLWTDVTHSAPSESPIRAAKRLRQDGDIAANTLLSCGKPQSVIHIN